LYRIPTGCQGAHRTESNPQPSRPAFPKTRLPRTDSTFTVIRRRCHASSPSKSTGT